IDCTLAPGANLNVPKSTPPSCDAVSHSNERTRIANNYPGKLVVFFSSGDTLTWSDSLNKWQYGPRGNSFSGGDLAFVAMGMNTAHQGGLADEMGHYLHLDHTFNAQPATVADAKKLVVDWVEKQGHTRADGAKVFDADTGTVSDTPPDPGWQLYQA